MDLHSAQARIFTHAPIASNQIRLLRVYRRRGQPIAGEFKIISLDDAAQHDFFAASYVWGEKTYTKTISVNAQDLPVLQSLYPFLEMVSQHQDFYPDDWWWIDSLCINQSDQEERSKQVKLMSQIYECATQIVIWLGEESEDSNTAMRFLKHLRQSRKEVGRNADERERLRAPGMKSNWKAVENLLLRPWWARVWTLQELVIPTHATFYCGSRNIRRSHFNIAVYSMYLCRAWDGVLLDKKAYDVAFNRRRLCQWFQETDPAGKGLQGLPLIAMLAYFGDHEASDPRDRIYSLLGLISPDDREMVGQPDYDASVHEVYARLVKSFVDEYESLDIICFAHIFNGRRGLRTEEAEFPSWVPDWTVKVQPRVMPLMVSQSPGPIGNLRPLDRWKARVCNATYNASEDIPPRVSFENDLRELVSEGVVLDVVDGVGGSSEHCEMCPLRREQDGGSRSIQSSSLLNVPLETREKESADHEHAVVTSTFDLFNDLAHCLVLGRKDKYLSEACSEVDNFGINLLQLCLNAMERPAESDPRFLTWFEYTKSLWFRGTCIEDICRNPALPQSLDTARSLERFHYTMTRPHRKLVVTEKGYLGMAPCSTRKGDVVCVLLGCSVPVILHRCGSLSDSDEVKYELVGECYVDGFMEGQAAEEIRSGRRTTQKFRMV